MPSTDIKDHQCKIPHIQLNSALARSQKSSKRAIETRLKVGRKLQHALKNNKERKKERKKEEISVLKEKSKQRTVLYYVLNLIKAISIPICLLGR